MKYGKYKEEAEMFLWELAAVGQRGGGTWGWGLSEKSSSLRSF